MFLTWEILEITHSFVLIGDKTANCRSITSAIHFFLQSYKYYFQLTLFSFCIFSYIIPVPVIKHFINGVEESGKYVGFCSMGLSCQPTENVQLRKHFGMRPEMTGVLVSRINPLSDAHRVLKTDDIILAFDGVPIANDGTGSHGYYLFSYSALLKLQLYLVHPIPLL